MCNENESEVIEVRLYEYLEENEADYYRYSVSKKVKNY